MLAKHETPMKDKRTTLGLVPAKFRIFVIRMRSMFVLLNADEMVNPPIRSIMVGENICENTYLIPREYCSGAKRNAERKSHTSLHLALIVETSLPPR